MRFKLNILNRTEIFFKSVIIKQFIRFAAVGVLNTCFGFMLYLLLLQFLMPPSTAVIITYVIGIFFNYFTHGRLVFQKASKRRILRFIGCYLLVCLLNLIGLETLLHLSISPEIAQLMLLIPLSIFAYLVMRVYVFRID
jgi:putative flippase GtrA